MGFFQIFDSRSFILHDMSLENDPTHAGKWSIVTDLAIRFMDAADGFINKTLLNDGWKLEWR